MTTPATASTPERERFADLLPWYVNGTIEASDRAWMEQYLAQHGSARSELAFFQTLRQDIHDTAPKVPSTIGLARTLQLIGGDRPSFSERIGAFFGNFGLRPATGLAMGLVALQAAVIVGLVARQPDDESSQMRAGPTVAVTDGPLLKVNFSPDARESDIRLLLVSVQGVLAGGPGQLGDYYVRVPSGREAAAAQTLKAAAIVQAVEMAAGLPARP